MIPAPDGLDPAVCNTGGYIDPITAYGHTNGPDRTFTVTQAAGTPSP